MYIEYIFKLSLLNKVNTAAFNVLNTSTSYNKRKYRINVKDFFYTNN